MSQDAPLPPTGAGEEVFSRLAPFIQEFIWREGWAELREIQIDAARAAFGTDRHLLLASGTASGKTEAAFLPILTQLYESPPNSVGALYIGPLKALINDQFLRLNDLCVQAEIAVTAWHGDISQSRKSALLKRPAGILQITPESLEGLLLNRPSDLLKLFGDLRWIVIDEVHAFMGSDRGGQVLALLDRLSRFSYVPGRLPRRAGLSATLGDYNQASAWLAGHSGKAVEVIARPTARRVRLLVDLFPVQEEDSSRSVTTEAVDEHGDDAAVADALISLKTDLFDAAYEATLTKKSLVFVNRRSEAEEITAGLRRLAEVRGTPDIYHVHHGSIAAPLRETAETAMREATGPVCTAATMTMELGIDLGQLDRVLQLGVTSSVASFLQRLGRAGRRGSPAEMFFLLREEAPDGNPRSVLEQIPWELVQAVAVIQLYAEEKWIEPLPTRAFPGSLLYQQTMSVIGAGGELTPSQIAERVLTLSPFRSVTPDDLKVLLRHLLAIDHLEATEEGGLILGLAGEKVVRRYQFLATFQDPIEWTVKEGAREIGSVSDAVPVGERIALAGRSWEVVDVVPDQRVLGVRRVKGRVKTSWSSLGAGEVHDRIIERMRRVLGESAVYPYLTARAHERLASARDLARQAQIVEGPCLVALGGDKYALVPWCGTRKLRTLSLALSRPAWIRSVARGDGPTLDLHTAMEPDEFRRTLAFEAAVPWDWPAILQGVERTTLEWAKYDEFLPDELLRKSFAADHLDADARTALESAVSAPSREPALGRPS